MAFTIPTTKQLADQFLAALEARINQTTPPVARAFNRVLSIAMAMFGSGLYKYLSDRTLQVLALTATGDGIDLIGSNYGVTRQAAVQSVLEATITADSGTIFPAGTSFTSETTNETYTTVDEVESTGTALLHVMAATAGENGTLAVGETLILGIPISGSASTAEILESEYDDGVVVAGADLETDASYRRRVLTRLRARGGGGNYADYREWAEAVDDVRRAFPYSGKPVTFYADDEFDESGSTITYSGVVAGFSFLDLGFHAGGMMTISGSAHAANNATFEILTVSATVITIVGTLTTESNRDLTLVNESLPGDRVVYVESESNSLATPQTTLDAVRAALLADQATGIARMPLGTTDERLYVESTRRTETTVYIVNMEVDSEVVSEAQAKVTTAVTDYVDRVCCYVDGLDYPGDRSDMVSRMSFSTVIQGVLRGYGGSAEAIHVDIGDDTDIDIYQLSQGELLRLATSNPVQFVTEYPPEA